MELCAAARCVCEFFSGKMHNVESFRGRDALRRSVFDKHLSSAQVLVVNASFSRSVSKYNIM